jgi:hypothetical protein
MANYNLEQVYTNNPITSNGSTDLMYFAASGTTDAGMTFGNFSAQFISNVGASKGDIAVYNGSSWVRLGVGTNTYVLTANSGATNGVDWEAASGGSLTWNDQTTTPVTITANNGYICDDGATQVVLNVPATIAQGAIFEVAGYASGGWQIQFNTGQTCYSSGGTETSSAGTLTSTGQSQSVRILCTVANTTFLLLSGNGNFAFA